ncbi:leuS [Acrasis kona]|uniref:LeuS n=1 Tax=Acrasis kona TaxID=1008807 RepID=A0AAW2ZNR5_9EUKA
MSDTQYYALQEQPSKSDGTKSQHQQDLETEDFHEIVEVKKPKRTIKQQWDDWKCKIGWVTIKNTGATARDMLALERTNLAWCRTALSSIGVGLTIAKLVKSSNSGLSQPALTAAGSVFMMSSLVMFIYSFMRTLVVMKQARGGEFSIDLISPFGVFAFGGAVSILAMILIYI